MAILEPKKTKHRKWCRTAGHSKGKTTKGAKLAYGSFGLKVTTGGRLTARQIEAARVAITRHIKRGGKVWLRAFPDKPVTKKPIEVGMGKGKGSVDHYVAVIRPGRILFEIEGVEQDVAEEAIKRASYKLPFQVKFVKK